MFRLQKVNLKEKSWWAPRRSALLWIEITTPKPLGQPVDHVVMKALRYTMRDGGRHWEHGKRWQEMAGND